jgi:mRNA interferase RelE/StbE
VPYRIEITNAGKQAIRRLDRQTQERVNTAILALADDPRPPASEKIIGGTDEYRLRVGGWRVLYRIQDSVLLVVIIDVNTRGDIYTKRRRT